MSDKPYHHGDLKRTLITLGKKALAKGGLDAISVRALAREAGVAHRAAYQHFADKDDLLAAILADGHLRLAKEMKKAAAEISSPEEKLVAAASAYGRFAFREPNLFLAMSGPRINEDGRYPELDANLAAGWRHIVDPIKDIKTATDAHGAAAIFWGGLQGVLAQIILKRIKVAANERGAFVEAIAKRLVIAIKA